MYLSETIKEKWQPVMEHADLPEIKDAYRRDVTLRLLENQEKFLEEQGLQEAAPVNSGHAPAGTNVKGWDPILISLVRRSMPHLLAYDVCGVQPMSGPTGLIFAMKSHYSAQDGTEASTPKLTQLSLETMMVRQLMLLRTEQTIRLMELGHLVKQTPRQMLKHRDLLVDVRSKKWHSVLTRLP